MPVITALTVQKRSTERYNLYLDNVYVFALPVLEVSAAGLRVGQELSDEAVEQLRTLADDNRAYEAALRYLEVRMRSRMEIRRQLERKGFSGETCNEVLERLQHSGLIDDQEFARRWVADRLAMRPRSRRQLEQELAAKGIQRVDVESVLREVEPDVQQAALERVIEKKRRIARYDNVKLTAYLVRQGYRYEEIKKALERLDDQTD
jgi:regulatory protein